MTGELVVDAARLRASGWSPPETTEAALAAGARARAPADLNAHAIDRRDGLSYVSVMAVLPIITLPDPVLRKISDPVERVDDAVVKLMDDMLETMYAAPGVGLAAIQVGVPKRVVVLDTAEDGAPPQADRDGQPGACRTRDPQPGFTRRAVSRFPMSRRDRAACNGDGALLDRNGKAQELEADGLLATAIQHELDHLDGQLIIDFLSRLKRDIIIRKFKKQGREGGRLTLVQAAPTFRAVARANT